MHDAEFHTLPAKHDKAAIKFIAQLDSWPSEDPNGSAQGSLVGHYEVCGRWVWLQLGEQ